MITTVSGQTMNNLSVGVRPGAWSGLSAGNDGLRAGVVPVPASKTMPARQRSWPPERLLHPSQPMFYAVGLHFYVALARLLHLFRPLAALRYRSRGMESIPRMRKKSAL